MDLHELGGYISNCEGCSLHVDRKVPVVSKGSLNAKIMICGMCPGPDENDLNNYDGLPFIGRAGKLLDEILVDADLNLDDVYITNVVKCYVKPGIKLEDEWIDSCFPFLINQISKVKPKIIVALGMDAARALISQKKIPGIGKVRKTLFKFDKYTNIIVTYHPSYLLRSGGKSHKNYNLVIDDLNFAKNNLTD